VTPAAPDGPDPKPPDGPDPKPPDGPDPKPPDPAVAKLLRWYPRAWRKRYGDEFLAMVEDSLDGRPPTIRLHLSVAWAGLRERGHQVRRAGQAADRRLTAGRARSATAASCLTAFIVIWYAAIESSALYLFFGITLLALQGRPGFIRLRRAARSGRRLRAASGRAR
jgi:hypothetical protein